MSAAEHTGKLILELQKTNHGRLDQQMTFRWDDDAHLFVGERIGASTFDSQKEIGKIILETMDAFMLEQMPVRAVQVDTANV